MADAIDGQYMPRHATLEQYQRRLENAPNPDETTTTTEYQNCLDHVNSVLDETDGEDYPDGDSRDNFGWNVKELHENRLLFEIPHSELPTFTLRWPDADITFISVRDPLPDGYYDDHRDAPNLNHYTTFVMDFGPYDAKPDAEDDEQDGTDDTDNWDEISRHNLRYKPSRYYLAA